MSGNQLFVVLIVGIIAATIILGRFADAIGARRKGSSKDETS